MMLDKNFGLNFWLFLIVSILAAGGLATASVFALKTNILLKHQLVKTQEAARPANLALTIINEPECPDCFDVTPLIEQLKKENVKITEEKTVARFSVEGQRLIEKWNIAKLPTVIISGELEKNANVKNNLARLGEIKDGEFILRQIGGPFVVAETSEIKGRVTLIMLTDLSCSECYDVTRHQAIIQQFGFYPQSEIFNKDSAEGQKLIKKYAIRLLPTVILTGDLAAYPQLKEVWKQVGVIAKDGAYVFKEGVKQMGIYKDLATGKIITPPPPG